MPAYIYNCVSEGTVNSVAMVMLSQHLADDSNGVVTEQSPVAALQAVGLLEVSYTASECPHVLFLGGRGIKAFHQL